jgi:hypothetical protein
VSLSPDQISIQQQVRRLSIFAGVVLMLIFASQTVSGKSVWQRIAEFIGLHGKPRPASANVLSEHEIARLDTMAPQGQAELLLERSINHYRGANDEIAKRVDGWRGGIQIDQRLAGLYETALNSDDLRVRAAAVEINIAGQGLVKSKASIDALENAARFGEPRTRALALWNIAFLGNRGVEPARAFQIVLASIHDPNVTVRHWAVEGLAYLGMDETIAPLLEVFHDDPSPDVRERAACGLSQSGMLSEKQRRAAVPRLLDYAEDRSLDGKTRDWVFEALRDITGQTLPHNASAWRNWYKGGHVQWSPVTRDGE